MNEQQQRDMVKKVKLQMWSGLVLIVVIGLIIAIYFIFLKNDRTDTTSQNNWKTYTNEIHGFSFQYPPEVTVVVDEPKREVDLKGPMLDSGKEWPRFYIANYTGDDYHPPEGTDLKEWITEKLGYEEFAEDRIIAGENAVHITTVRNIHDDQIERYYFLKNGQIFQADILNTDGKVDWDIYNKFLDSITFDIVEEDNTSTSLFESVSTTDWLTYVDDKNNYSIKYPSDYFVKEELENYATFDTSLIDNPESSHLSFTVETRDTDLYTFRLSILTDEQVSGDFDPIIEDITIDGLSGTKITLKNKLGKTIVHNLVNYLGKTYDISAGDSLSDDILKAVVDNFYIEQFGEDVDITDTSLFESKECVSNSDCGAYPCNPSINKCLIKSCQLDSECSVGVCGLHASPVPGYCTTIDTL